MIKMAYSMVIPPEMVEQMFWIRQNTGIPIRRQAIRAMERYVEDMKDKSIEKVIHA